ncbi:MAG: DUF6514 family protein [Clostridium sp.]|uniref:DUF6514 family protein n=1 Tax=Clostridium TaxID=1485 RepID=UPI00215276E7|nr:DUF6514 family protein [Clostridium sp. LY3-2]MCR6513918.1 DUF6514 family protein [Clostridium sp. LY3-2]
MIKEKLVFKRVTNGIERIYNYKLIKSVLGIDEVFGIEIERLDYKGEIKINSYSEAVELISPNEEKVKGLLNMLYENGVSPIHLIDIAGEFIDECVNDFQGIEHFNYAMTV